MYWFQIVLILLIGRCIYGSSPLPAVAIFVIFFNVGCYNWTISMQSQVPIYHIYVYICIDFLEQFQKSKMYCMLVMLTHF
jgi:hypothetical protein